MLASEEENTSFGEKQLGFGRPLRLWHQDFALLFIGDFGSKFLHKWNN